VREREREERKEEEEEERESVRAILNSWTEMYMKTLKFM
jgi:hypothetical protein